MVTQSNFNRDYRLTITKGERQKIIVPPFRFSFSCDKSIEGNGLNKLIGSVWGLKKETRNFFRKNQDDTDLIKITLEVGYENALKPLFSGDISIGSSTLTRNSYVTKFEVLDGGHDYLNSFTSKTVSGKSNAINSILEDMPNTQKGKVSTDVPELLRPKVLMGPSSQLLEDLTRQDQDFYIDNGKINIIGQDEVTLEYIPKVSAKTGLLPGAKFEKSKLTFKTMLNPFITIGGRLQFESFIDERMDGTYKVQSITTSGDTRGQDWSQAVTCVALPNYKVVG